MVTFSHMAPCQFLAARIVTHAVLKWVRDRRGRSSSSGRKGAIGGTRLGKAIRRRRQRSVEEIYRCLGPIYFRRAYRMTFANFTLLHTKLRDGILKAVLDNSRVNNSIGKKETEGEVAIFLLKNSRTT